MVVGEQRPDRRFGVLESERGPRKYAIINRRFVGKDAAVILREAGIPCGPEKRLVVCEVDADHPFLWTELMMPVLPLVRTRNVDEAIDLAVAAEHGFRHTASMHSRNIDKLHKMARACDCSIFVKNGPNASGLGWNGEGPTSFTIASPLMKLGYARSGTPEILKFSSARAVCTP